MQQKQSISFRNNMPEIRPITDLRVHSAEISHLVNDENTPVILTKNGYANMVVLSYNSYVQLNAKQELYRLLDESMDDYRNGRVQNFENVFKELREEIDNGKL